MIKELAIEGMTVGKGVLRADLRVKTVNGAMGLASAFELRNEPEISDAVTALENAVENALVKNLALGTQVEEGSDKKAEAVS